MTKSFEQAPPQVDTNPEQEAISQEVARRIAEAEEKLNQESGGKIVKTLSGKERAQIRRDVQRDVQAEFDKQKRSDALKAELSNLSPLSTAQKEKQMEEWHRNNPDKVKEYNKGAERKNLEKEIEENGGGTEGAANLLAEKFGKSDK